jgi:hypothetical protein
MIGRPRLDSWQRQRISSLDSLSRPAHEAHLASYSVGTGGSFPRVKVGLRRDTDLSPTYIAEVMNSSYTSSPPPGACMVCTGQLYFLKHIEMIHGMSS